jgi:hypothetical protein
MNGSLTKDEMTLSVPPLHLHLPPHAHSNDNLENKLMTLKKLKKGLTFKNNQKGSNKLVDIKKPVSKDQ